MPTSKSKAPKRVLKPETILENFTRHLFAKCGLGITTVQNHVGCIRRIMPIIGTHPTSRDAERLIMEMRKAGKSPAHQANVCVSIEKYSAFMGTRIKLGRPRAKHQLPQNTLNEAEVARLIHASNSPRQRAILALLAYSGIRNKELCFLRMNDLEQSKQVLHVRGAKTQRDRAVALPASCLAVLNEYLHNYHADPGDWMFKTARTSLQLEQQDLRKMVKSIALRAGVTKRVHPHLFRHSLATNLLSRDSGVLAIKEQLGHANLATTMRYLHVVPGRMQEEYRMHAPVYV